MSTPPGIKDIWKNMTWESPEEKLAFFNHYFVKGDIADNFCKEKIGLIKDSLIEFIEEGVVKLKDGKERKITKADIIEEIRRLVQ